MAGIGFRLRKLIEKNSYLSLIEGFLYASIISAGPIIFTIICVGVLGILSSYQLLLKSYLIFRATIVYIYAFSLIFAGIWQMVVTRYISDRLYLKDDTRVVPVYITLMVLQSIIGFCFAALYFSMTGMHFRYVISASLLFVFICAIWTAMTFVSTTKNYNIIVNGFLVGNLVGLLSGYYLGASFGLMGYLNGFLIGQIVIFCILSSAVFREYPFTDLFDRGFLSYFKWFPELLLIGLVFNLGIWIDKFIFWFSPDSTQIIPMLRTYSAYERAVFIAYLSVVPALGLFMIRVETSFYIKYRLFYEKIVHRRSLKEIKNAHKDIIQDVHESIGILLKVQGTITLFLVAFYQPICQFLNFTGIEKGIFRIAVLGVFLLVLLQLIILLMLYFELRKEVLIVVSIYCVTNAFFTWLSIKIGTEAFGYGLFFAGLISLAAAYAYFSKCLNELEYYTFMQQPLRNIRG